MSRECLPVALAPPAIPGYELLEKIGDGGMGEVFQARQVSLERLVAIKFLRAPDGSQSLPSIHLKRNEPLLLARANHPNVVAVYDCGEAQGCAYVVMEFVSGHTLRSRMHPGQPWSVRDTLAIVRSMGDALTYVHGAGILHLDLKPENVLCTLDAQVKISDFGLATLAGATESTSGMTSYGSIDYCAPEVSHGLGTDARSDVYSLATITYELLTGTLPWRVYSLASARNREVSLAVDRVLRKALSRDADDRHASVAEYCHSLIRAVEAPRRHRRLVAASLFSVAVTTAFAAGAWALTRHFEALAEQPLRAFPAAHGSVDPFGGESAAVVGARLYELGKYAEAEFALEAATRQEPNNARLHAMLGDTYHERGKWDLMESAYAKALEVEPPNANRLSWLAVALAMQGKWGAAATTCDRAAEAAPLAHQHYYWATVLHLAAGDQAAYRQARAKILDKFATTQDPAIAERSAKACLLVADDDAAYRDAAQRLADFAVAGNESHAYYQYFLVCKGMAEYRAGRFERALAILEGADPSLKPTKVLGTLFLAMSLHQTGETTRARDHLTEALRAMEAHAATVRAPNRWGTGWHDWLMCDVVRQEAEALLATSAGAATGSRDPASTYPPARLPTD